MTPRTIKTALAATAVFGLAFAGMANAEAADDTLVIDVEVEGVVGVGRVVRMAALRLGPGDHLAGVLDDRLAGGDRAQRVDALAVHAGAADLDAAPGPAGRLPSGPAGRLRLHGLVHSVH